MNRLISVMTSRHPAEALRPNSPSARVLSDFLEYLGAWEQHAGGAGGFLSESTAVGLRVTLTSTLELLSYLSTIGYRYLMTSRLSQDPLENIFGIVRQSSGCNNHPTPTQFLVTMNCLSFYSLIKTVRYGNSDPCAVSALLDATASDSTSAPSNSLWERVDAFIESGNLQAAERALTVSHDHSQHIEKSDSRLTYYVAGYVARKCVLKTKCEACKQTLTVPASEEDSEIAELTRLRDKGGLLYPRGALFTFVETLENLFTECFSKSKLHCESILDVLSLAKEKCTSTIGCSEHATELTLKVVSFYITTRLHFFVKGVNAEKRNKRQTMKLRKMSKCT